MSCATCMITQRIWNRRAIDYSTMQYAMFLIMRDVRHKSAQEISATLTARLAEEKETFASNDRFSLHGMNGRQIHHVLARMTEFIEIQSGMASRYADYIVRSERTVTRSSIATGVARPPPRAGPVVRFERGLPPADSLIQLDPLFHAVRAFGRIECDAHTIRTRTCHLSLVLSTGAWLLRSISRCAAARPSASALSNSSFSQIIQARTFLSSASLLSESRERMPFRFSGSSNEVSSHACRSINSCGTSSRNVSADAKPSLRVLKHRAFCAYHAQSRLEKRT